MPPSFSSSPPIRGPQHRMRLQGGAIRDGGREFTAALKSLTWPLGDSVACCETEMGMGGPGADREDGPDGLAFQFKSLMSRLMSSVQRARRGCRGSMAVVDRRRRSDS